MKLFRIAGTTRLGTPPWFTPRLHRSPPLSVPSKPKTILHPSRSDEISILRGDSRCQSAILPALPVRLRKGDLLGRPVLRDDHAGAVESQMTLRDQSDRKLSKCDSVSRTANLPTVHRKGMALGIIALLLPHRVGCWASPAAWYRKRRIVPPAMHPVEQWSAQAMFRWVFRALAWAAPWLREVAAEAHLRALTLVRLMAAHRSMTSRAIENPLLCLSQ